MRASVQKQNQPHKRGSSSLTRSNTAAPGQYPRANALLQLQHTIGNQAVQRLLQQSMPDDLEARSHTQDVMRSMHGFGQLRLPSRSLANIQAKLTVSSPGDIYEQEAERLSAQVMRMPEPQLQRACACSGECPKCQTEESGQEHMRLQGKGIGSIDLGQTAVPAIVHQVLRSPGQPLDARTRSFMEPRFGRDFSQVRVHTDPLAARSAGAVAAHAYTTGYDIVFGAGQYTPGTREGQRLLAHELAHVTQQEAAGHGAGYRLFRQKDEGKTPPPLKTPATPCRPKFISLKAEITGSVGVREVNGRCELMLGTPGKANGVTFIAKVDVPAGCTGTLQYVQLVDTCRSMHLASGKDIRKKTGGYWIDKQDPVDQQQVSSSGPVEFSTNDSPGQPIAGPVETVQVKDSFKMWLMWKPDQPASANRVPLAMASWKWSAEAKVKKPDAEDCATRWAVTTQNTTGGTGRTTKDSPTATKTVTPTDPPIEEGKGKC